MPDQVANHAESALIPGEEYAISDLPRGSVASIDGNRCIVTSRTPEDRSSGSTEVTYENGGRPTFFWDYEDPVVVYEGRGRLVTLIQLDPETPQ
jgi:hypothetical protein